MAPERFRTGETTPGCDIYALSCVLYQCLTGHVPFRGNTFEQIALAHLADPPPTPSTHDPARIPALMDTVIATGLAKEPAQRYQSATELAAAARHALTAPLSHTPVDPAHPRPPSALINEPIESRVEADRHAVDSTAPTLAAPHKPTPSRSSAPAKRQAGPKLALQQWWFRHRWVTPGIATILL
ncbi:hypothetical protein [Mycobacterium simiae]|uniref:hypothetical protein n=1 Tax=Mycobacterium simiae TaxID=1784 RepID=UPI0027B9CD9F|nr:hypothetical protein [Mycobacterium simiae]